VSANDDPHVYPGTATLRNRFNYTDPAKLDRAERRLAADRATQPIPRGSFDLPHLCAIHRHLFQDIYDWAGELRTVEISKGSQQFQFRQFIETGMADVHRRLVRSRFLHGLSPTGFAEQAAVILGDINYIHPFREGNGRTQLQYLKQLAQDAGYTLDLAWINGPRWIEASMASHAADYRPMATVIAAALKGPD
jgi:cell filamentation protein, protein adenylyltransferase